MIRLYWSYIDDSNWMQSTYWWWIMLNSAYSNESAAAVIASLSRHRMDRLQWQLHFFFDISTRLPNQFGGPVSSAAWYHFTAYGGSYCQPRVRANGNFTFSGAGYRYSLFLDVGNNSSSQHCSTPPRIWTLSHGLSSRLWVVDSQYMLPDREEGNVHVLHCLHKLYRGQTREAGNRN